MTNHTRPAAAAAERIEHAAVADGGEVHEQTRFAGRTAVVTGGARGIGAACAQRLAAGGAAVLVADVEDADAEQVVAGIEAGGGRAVAVHCDVARPDDWAALRAMALYRFGGVDVLVSNAYAITRGPAHQLRPQDWDTQLAVTLGGLYLGVHTLADQLAAVVAVSSVHARFGLPGHPAYAAAKGGILSLVRQLAAEYAPRMRVNAVVPGPILTAAWRDADKEAIARSARATALGRLGSAEEVAAAVAFLVSDDAAFITGASLTVDGGWSVVKESA